MEVSYGLGYLGCIPFHPGRPPFPASPCGVYAGIPGDPPQLHARRLPLQALPGPFPARRGTFAKVGDPRPRRRRRPGILLPLDAEPLWGLNPKWTAGGRTAGP